MKCDYTCIIRRVGVIMLSVMLLLIAVFSLMPASSLPSPGSDKIAHFASYALLAISAFLSFFISPYEEKGLFKSNIKVLIGAFILCTLFGLLLELIQPFFNRSSDILDLCANMGGIVVGLIVSFAFIKLYTNHLLKGKESAI